MKLKALIQLLRPHQWLKSLFVLLPLFFGKQLTNVDSLLLSLVAVISYSAISSSVYCFNDICDYKTDKSHPVKKKRPLASGQVSSKEGFILMFLLVFFSFAILYFFGGIYKWNVMFFLLLYYILNIAYCIKLKKIALMDVFVIASGFVMRVIVGGIITNIYLSHWIILMTFLIALFLAIAKRRDDVLIFEETHVVVRESTINYNLIFLNFVLSMVGTVTLVCYIMYVVSDEIMIRFNNQYIYLTTIFVLAGIIRYFQLMMVYDKGGSPTEILLKDRFIQFCVIGWIMMFFIFIYM